MLSFKKQTLQAPMRGIDSDTDITIDQTLINNVFGLENITVKAPMRALKKLIVVLI